MKLTLLQQRALLIAPSLGRDGRFTCAMLGEALFAQKRFAEWKVWPLDMQRFARPGGKVVAALVRAGKVQPSYGSRDAHVYYRVANR